jgi:hypothetical protein
MCIWRRLVYLHKLVSRTVHFDKVSRILLQLCGICSNVCRGRVYIQASFKLAIERSVLSVLRKVVYRIIVSKILHLSATLSYLSQLSQHLPCLHGDWHYATSTELNVSCTPI